MARGSCTTPPSWPYGRSLTTPMPTKAALGRTTRRSAPTAMTPARVAGSRPGDGEHGVDEGEERGEGGEEEGHGIPVEDPGGRREERAETGRGRGQPRVVEEAPGQDPRRVVESEVAGDEKQKAGNDRPVDADRPMRGQAPLPPDEETGTREPQEHTRLRTAHSILSRRPHAGQPM